MYKTKKIDIQALFITMRPGQWVKNLIIFLPLIFGKELFDFGIFMKTASAFLLFSFTTSASYLINDIIDFEKDKIHPLKSFRPIASGRVNMKQARLLALFLAGVSLPASFLLDSYFGMTMLFYVAFNLIYSKILKKIVIIDVFCIGFFFLLRIIAGSLISGIRLSHWIILMVVMLALFLGFNKRRQELETLETKAESHRDVLAKYNTYFLDQMIAVLTSSIVVFYTLYTVDQRTMREFGTNHLILSIPFVYYGIFRYLYIIHKRRAGDDPTGVLLSDRPMQINLICWIMVCIGVVYFGL